MEATNIDKITADIQLLESLRELANAVISDVCPDATIFSLRLTDMGPYIAFSHKGGLHLLHVWLAAFESNEEIRKILTTGLMSWGKYNGKYGMANKLDGSGFVVTE